MDIDNCLWLPPTFKLKHIRLTNMHVVSDRTHRPNIQDLNAEDTQPSRRFWTDRKLNRRHSVDIITQDLTPGNPTWQSVALLPNFYQGANIEQPAVPSDPPYNRNVRLHGFSTKVLEMDRSDLGHPAFDTILSKDINGWFEGETIDSAFEMLEYVTQCRKYRMVLANTTDTKSLFTDGHTAEVKGQAGGDIPEDMFPDVNCDDKCAALLKDKDFVMFPISDGLPGYLNKDFPPWADDLIKISSGKNV